MPFDGSDRPQKYRVRWRDEVSGIEGFGKLLDYENAAALADFGNREYPYLSHWVEPSAT